MLTDAIPPSYRHTCYFNINLKMLAEALVFLCTALTVQASTKTTEIQFSEESPSVQIEDNHTAELKCCYNVASKSVNITWLFHEAGNQKKRRVLQTSKKYNISKMTDKSCCVLTISYASTVDVGFYQCKLSHDNHQPVYSYGTFLKVYKSIKKILKMSENAKNKILIVEGVLLLLCMLLPGVVLISKKQKLHELGKKKKLTEELNIYEGLNLEECSSAYHQIQRSQLQSPYQDVDNVRDQDVQLEKP